MAKFKSGTTTNEPSWYAEIASYRHENAGKVSVETVSTANKPVSPTADSERITRLGKVRVETRVTEWKGTGDDGKVYQKDIETIQINDSSVPSSSSTGLNPQYTGEAQKANPDGLSPLQVLKNFVDNIAADNRTQWVCMVAIGLIAAAALVMSIILLK